MEKNGGSYPTGSVFAHRKKVVFNIFPKEGVGGSAKKKGFSFDVFTKPTIFCC